MESQRPVKEIQAELLTAAEELLATAKRLRLVELMTQLERSYPAGLDTESVGEGDVCPPLPWEVHADVGNAKILLEEAIESLDQASRRTEHDVRHEWIVNKLQEIPDPATRALLTFYFTTMIPVPLLNRSARMPGTGTTKDDRKSTNASNPSSKL